MNNNKNNHQILIGGIVLFRDYKKKKQYLLVKHKDDGEWELPKVTVRKGESSVRAAIRMTGEQIGVSARVLEEVGRFNGSTVINNKPVTQKFYFYLVMQRAGSGEVMGFNQSLWAEYPIALKKLGLKKEREIFKSSKDILKEWEKTKKHKIDQEEEELLLQEQEEARLAG